MKNKPIRGFDKLVGETIKKIDATGINCVFIETESGKKITIDADELHYGIPVVQCRKTEGSENAK